MRWDKRYRKAIHAAMNRASYGWSKLEVFKLENDLTGEEVRRIIKSDTHHPDKHKINGWCPRCGISYELIRNGYYPCPKHLVYEHEDVQISLLGARVLHDDVPVLVTKWSREDGELLQE